LFYLQLLESFTVWEDCTVKVLGCFNPNLGRIWTNPNVGLKMEFKNFNPTLNFIFYCAFFNNIFNPTLGFVHI